MKCKFCKQEIWFAYDYHGIIRPFNKVEFVPGKFVFIEHSCYLEDVVKCSIKKKSKISKKGSWT
jgi:hypothetical protein